jgi:spore maturation protein CgeB
MNRRVMVVSTGDWQAGLSMSYMRALRSFGLDVAQFDLEGARAAETPLGRAGRRLMQHLDFFAINAKANRVLVRAAMDRQPALIVVMGVEAVRPATLLALKIGVPGVKIVNIFPDMLFNVRDSMFACLPLYDLFCCHTRAGVPFLRQAGCAGAYYLPLAADPTLHRPEPLDDADVRAYGCDLVFVGNHRPEHAALFCALEGMDLRIYGSSNWRGASSAWVRSRFAGRALMTGVEYAKAHRAAKICLNPIDPLDLPGHNQRTFEVPACGGFPLVSRSEEVLELFREGESVACFEGEAELVDKVRYYLARPDERRRIADNAYKAVIEGGHTYRDRVVTLFERLGLTGLLEERP